MIDNLFGNVIGVSYLGATALALAHERSRTLGKTKLIRGLAAGQRTTTTGV